MFGGLLGYRRGVFRVESVPAERIARTCGTPCYVYSRAHIVGQIRSFREAFSAVRPTICYSVKANSNLSILKLIREQELGADAVSEGEIRRALRSGFPAKEIVFAGVGKGRQEIEFAVRKGIRCLNVENPEELEIVESVAAGCRRSVACNLRFNLDVDVDTHHYVKTSRKESKFGMDLTAAARIIRGRKRYRWAVVRGFHFHLGSQIRESSPYIEALEKLSSFARQVRFQPEIVDIGGGYGVPYAPGEMGMDFAALARRIRGFLGRFPIREMILEPGRCLVANAGVLLVRVLYVKKRHGKTFVIVDGAMNDLIRPSLYGSHHTILPAVLGRRGAATADIVGPICETGDLFASGRLLPYLPKPGDLLVVANAGAYGFSMSSNYNSRRRPCEILVDGDRFRLIRRRERFEDLWAGE